MLKHKTAFSLYLLLALACLLSAGWALAPRLQAADIEGSAATRPPLTQEGRIMTQTQVAAVPRVGKPPIDAAVPAKIATATFALG
jgi:hypothetical protein